MQTQDYGEQLEALTKFYHRRSGFLGISNTKRKIVIMYLMIQVGFFRLVSDQVPSNENPNG